MKKIYSKDAPYKGTKIAVEKTKENIDRMLRKYGVKKIGWDFDPEHDDIELTFQFEEEIDGEPVMPVIRIRPPEIWKTVRGYSRKHQRSVKGDILYWPQGMRCLFWYIKSHLEMTRLGYSKTQEFLPHISLRLPDGRETQLGKIIIPRINRLDKLALKAAEIPALTERKETT